MKRKLIILFSGSEEHLNFPPDPCTLDPIFYINAPWSYTPHGEMHQTEMFTSIKLANDPEIMVSYLI